MGRKGGITYSVVGKKAEGTIDAGGFAGNINLPELAPVINLPEMNPTINLPQLQTTVNLPELNPEIQVQVPEPVVNVTVQVDFDKTLKFVLMNPLPWPKILGLISLLILAQTLIIVLAFKLYP